MGIARKEPLHECQLVKAVKITTEIVIYCTKAQKKM